jgi:hypothetical protein
MTKCDEFELWPASGALTLLIHEQQQQRKSNSQGKITE